MSTTFATNAAANSAVSYLSRNSEMQSSSIAKLSSGSRIVKASDDAASLAVGTKLKADVAALKQASVNASQASSFLQVVDGAYARVSDTLVRMKSLATQANSDVLSNTERGYLDNEYQQLATQIDFIGTSTQFNGQTPLDGGATLLFQVGITAGAGDPAVPSGDEIAVTIEDSDAAALMGIAVGDITTTANAAAQSAALDTAIGNVNGFRAELGAQMSRFEKIGENIATTMENLDAARSVLMDVDVADEMTKFSTNQVMTQAATAMLAQANQLPQNLMRLLQ